MVNSETLSDEIWTCLSQKDPYWSVLTIDKYHGVLSPERRAEFFRTGEQLVSSFLKRAFRLQPQLKLTSAIDFGCGVGRLTLPLCRRVKHVFAVDVSQTMLELCEKNCREEGFYNVIPLKSDDRLSSLDGIEADLVVSSITFQHIRPMRGLQLMEGLIRRLKPDGVLGVFVLIAGESDQPTHGADYRSIQASPESYIEMNVYPLESIVSMLSKYTDQITLVPVPMGHQLGADIFCARRAQSAV